jgi:hypothetical protein
MFFKKSIKSVFTAKAASAKRLCQSLIKEPLQNDSHAVLTKVRYGFHQMTMTAAQKALAKSIYTSRHISKEEAGKTVVRFTYPSGISFQDADKISKVLQLAVKCKNTHMSVENCWPANTPGVEIATAKAKRWLDL